MQQKVVAFEALDAFSNYFQVVLFSLVLFRSLATTIRTFRCRAIYIRPIYKFAYFHWCYSNRLQVSFELFRCRAIYFSAFASLLIMILGLNIRVIKCSQMFVDYLHSILTCHTRTETITNICKIEWKTTWRIYNEM